MKSVIWDVVLFDAVAVVAAVVVAVVADVVAVVAAVAAVAAAEWRRRSYWWVFSLRRGKSRDPFSVQLDFIP